MIFIAPLTSKPTLLSDWEAKAVGYLAKLAAASNKSTHLDKNGNWKDIKNTELLQTKYNYKCWLSEERVSGYGHVEHYRPKLKVEPIKQKKPKRDVDALIRRRIPTFAEQSVPVGNNFYWWLAYDYNNYLFVNECINTTYKQNFFPIRVDSTRATDNTMLLEGEEPFLLNPTNPRDPELLYFNEFGEVEPVANLGAWENERAWVSIVVYGLNEKLPLIERRREKWALCIEKIEKSEEIFQELITMKLRGFPKNEIDKMKDKFEKSVDEIKDFKADTSEYAATARCCILVNRKTWMPKAGL